MPCTVAPSVTRKRARSWTCGSQAALRSVVVPRAATAAISAFSVAVTLGSSRKMSAPASRLASTWYVAPTVTAAPSCSRARKCVSTRRRPMTSPPGGGRLSTPCGVDILHPMNEPRGLSRIELLQGTLDLIILQTLRWGPRHGYGIAQMIRASSHDVLQVDTGSLYPALHRLERQGWIAAEWSKSENKQRVRVYTLTAKGRKQLERERSQWEQLSHAIAAIILPPAESEP